MTALSPFFTLHSDLPREGPGEPADVRWALEQAKIAADASICDLACGPGADIETLLTAVPNGHVTAVDRAPHFVEAVRHRFDGNDRVIPRQADMAKLEGVYDLIWCAGAVYFLGLQKALRLWRSALKPGGAIAFSEPCYFSSTPSDAARTMWEGEGTVLGKPAIATQIGLAGYELIAARQLSDAAWENYYGPMADRIDHLWPTADVALREVLEEARREIALWRAAKHETGYLLCVVRPI